MIGAGIGQSGLLHFLEVESNEAPCNSLIRPQALI